MSSSTTASPHPPVRPADFKPTSFLDTSQPNMGRVFDYMAGGSAHFAVDREAAQKMLAIFPPIQKWVLLRKSFAFEATQYLYQQQRFRQFLDLGSGMPSPDAPHQLLPEARFVYSDLNPVAVSYGRSLFANQTEVDYVQADVRRIETLLQDEVVQRLIDPGEKVAIGLNSLLVFLSETAVQQLAKELFDWAAPGSQLFFLAQARSEQTASAAMAAFTAKLQQIGLPGRFASVSKLRRRLQPWRLQLHEPVDKFMGLPSNFLDDADGINLGITFNALFLIKKVQ